MLLGFKFKGCHFLWQWGNPLANVSKVTYPIFPADYFKGNWQPSDNYELFAKVANVLRGVFRKVAKILSHIILQIFQRVATSLYNIYKRVVQTAYESATCLQYLCRKKISNLITKKKLLVIKTIRRSSPSYAPYSPSQSRETVPSKNSTVDKIAEFPTRTSNLRTV